MAKYQLLIKLVFGLGLLLLPFVYWPKALVPFEIPRVWVFWRWTEILIILSLVGLPWRYKTIKVKNALLMWQALWVGAAILASLTGSDWVKSVWGNYYRMDGLLTLFHLVALSISLSLVWDKSWQKWLNKPIVWGAVVLSAWVAVEAFDKGIFENILQGNFGRSVGVSFGQPNFLGGYLAVVFPFLWWEWTHQSRKWARLFWLLMMGLVIGAIILSHSKGGLLGVGVFGLWLVWFSNWPKKIKGAILLCGVAASIFFYWQIYNPDQPYVAESRLRIAHRLKGAFVQKPVLGWGYANIDRAIEKIVWPYPVRFDVYIDKAHSLIGEYLVGTGLVGFLVFVGLVGQTVKILWKGIPKGQQNKTFAGLLLSVLVVYLFHAQTNIISINEEMIFWLVVGIAGSGKLKKY